MSGHADDLKTLSAFDAPDLPAPGTKLVATGKKAPWRLLADDWAWVLTPVCDDKARPLQELPSAVTWEVWPCRRSYPDFSQTHPKEFAELKGRFLAGEFPPTDGKLPPRKGKGRNWSQVPSTGRVKFWPGFLEQEGNRRLWKKVVNDELRKHWLVDEVKDRGPAFLLSWHTRTVKDAQRKPENTVTPADLARIRFCAVFATGNKRTTVYLSECVRDALTAEDRQHTPGAPQREEQLAGAIKAAAKEQANAARTQKRAVEAERKLVHKKAKLRAKRLTWSMQEQKNGEGQLSGGVVNYSSKGKSDSVPIGYGLAQIILILDAAKGRTLSKQEVESQVKARRSVREYRAERDVNSHEGFRLQELKIFRVHNGPKQVAYSLAPHK